MTTTTLKWRVIGNDIERRVCGVVIISVATTTNTGANPLEAEQNEKYDVFDTHYPR
jgi:hypothetical protein